MKKLLVVSIAVVTALIFSSCAKECTCSVWEDGKDVDDNPTVFEQDEMDALGAKSCKDLQNTFGVLAYDDATQSGIVCE